MRGYFRYITESCDMKFDLLCRSTLYTAFVMQTFDTIYIHTFVLFRYQLLYDLKITQFTFF